MDMTAEMSPRRILLRIPEVAQTLGLGRTTVYQLVKDGILPTVRIGRRGVRIPVDALNDWVTENIKAPQSEDRSHV